MKKSVCFFLIISILGCTKETINENTESELIDGSGFVSVIKSGVISDGNTDCRQEIQDLLDNPEVKTIHFDADHIFIIDVNNGYLNVPSNKTLIIDGILRIRNRYYNSIEDQFDLIRGDSVENVKIIGNGVIDGNGVLLKDYDRSYHRLIRFNNSSNIEISVKTIENNISRNYQPPQNTFHTVGFYNCSNIFIHDLTLTKWMYEGIGVKDCKNSTIDNVTFLGEAGSWSGIQVGQGSLNTINSCYVYNAGASGIGFDTKNSTISNCRVENNRYHNGFNFGHNPGEPTEDCYIINCIARTNLIDLSTERGYYGFNFSSTSKNNTLVNCQAIGYCGGKAAGFNISKGRTYLENIKADSCSHGLKIYDAEVYVSNAQLQHNLGMPFFNVDNCETYSFENVRLSEDSFTGEVNLINHQNGELTISNGNVTKMSDIDLKTKDSESTHCSPFIKEKGNGYFIIGLLYIPKYDANIDYRIN